MATQITLRRGTAAEHATFTGAEAEVTVNTTNDTLHVHDGVTPGGFEVPGLAVVSNWAAPQRSADTVDNSGAFDLNVAQNFTCTPAGIITLTFTNIPDGQSGLIVLDNTGGFAISAAATTKVMGADLLADVSTAGIYVIGYISDGTNVRIYNSGAQQ
jgi:hypothetical protein